jgi:hypothetical protein
MIISVDAKKTFDKTQHPFMIKVLTELRMEGVYLNIIKAMHDETDSQHHTKWGKLKPFPLRLGLRQGCLLSPLLFNIMLKNLTQSSKTRERNKRDIKRKGRRQITLICR